MNDYLFLGICSVVTIACFYVIIAPFFARKPEALLVNEGGAMSGEALSVEAIYRAVNEVEMDFLMKKITKEDFQQMKEHYQMMAADLLNNGEPTSKREEVSRGAAEIDQEILAELTKIRSRKGS